MSIPTINTDSSLRILYWGLAFRMTVALKDDGVPMNVAGQVLTAQILTEDHTTAITAAVALSDAATGANWTIGRVVVEIPALETGKGDATNAVLAIYGVDGGDTWGRFLPLHCKQGLPNV